MKSLGSSKVAIFDKEQKDFLSKEAKAHMIDLRKEMDKNKGAIAEALKVQQKQSKSVEDEIRNREKVSKLIQRQVRLQKEYQSASQAKTTFSGASARKGVLGRIGEGLSGMPGIGRLGGLARFAGPLGILAGGAMFGASRATQAYSTFTEGIPDRERLRGRGVGDLELRDEERAGEAGLNALSVRRARLGAMDVFGRSGATQEAVIQRAEVERNFGIERGTLVGMGGQMRGLLGGEGANKATMTIQAGLIASGITDEIGPYLETAANMLTNLNESGFTFNDSAMAVLTNLTTRGVAAERAGRMITGADQAFRGSTGEANAFFQQVVARAGMGGGTIGGNRAVIRGGMFGANIDEAFLSETDKKAFRGIGMGRAGSGQKIAQSIVDLVGTKFKEDEVDALLRSQDPEEQDLGAQRRLMRNNFMMRMFGLENEMRGGELFEMIKQMADPNISAKKRAQIEQKAKDLSDGNSELGNLKLINKSTAGMHTVLKNQHETIKDTLGRQIAPTMHSMDQTMMKLDTALSALLKFFGIDTPDEKLKESLTGTTTLNQETFDQATMGDPKKEKEFSKDLANEYMKNFQQIQQLKEEGVEKDYRRTGFRGEKYQEMQDLIARNERINDTFRKIEGADPSGHMGNDRAREFFNEQTRKRAREESNSFKFNLFGNDDDYKSPIKRAKEGTNENPKDNKPVDLSPILKDLLAAVTRTAVSSERLERKPNIWLPPAKGEKVK